MDTTPNLALPYIMAAQAQKHVTHNEAIRALDAVVQVGVLDRDLAAPPASPADGDRWIVAAGATGAWTGEDGSLAAWQDGAWAFHAPRPGWLAWIADEGRLVSWDGTGWIDAAAGSLNPTPLLGVNAAADTTSRLTVASPATLLTHAGAGHQLKLNKAAPADTASLVWQTAFSGRAEVGTAGDDDLHVKVSPDGAAWHEALHVERTTGRTVFRKLVQWLGDLLGGAVVWRYVPPASDPTAPRFSMSFTSQPWSNGPPGQPSYVDHAAFMGWNYVAGDREDVSQSGFGIAWESRFYQSGTFASEFHLQGKTSTGVDKRWLSFFLPHDGGPESGGYMALDYFAFRDNAGASVMRVDMRNRMIEFPVGMLTTVDANNTVVVRQKNAAGTAYVSLPYVDNYNRVSVGGGNGLFVNANTSDGEYGAVLPVNVTTLAANKSLLYGQQATQTTGNVYAFNLYNMQATGKVIGGVGNSAGGGNAILEARVEAGGNDPMLSVLINGGQGYALGIDNSDGDKFKISAGNQRLGNGTEDRVVIDANTVAVVNRPFKLPSYTVAGLPSASAAGAGALAYVSNASGGPTIACSDGTSWRVAPALGATVS